MPLASRSVPPKVPVYARAAVTVFRAWEVRRWAAGGAETNGPRPQTETILGSKSEHGAAMGATHACFTTTYKAGSTAHLRGERPPTTQDTKAGCCVVNDGNRHDSHHHDLATSANAVHYVESVYLLCINIHGNSSSSPAWLPSSCMRQKHQG